MTKIEIWMDVWMDDENIDLDPISFLFIETDTKTHPEVVSYLELVADQCVHHLDKKVSGFRYSGWDQKGLGYIITPEVMIRIMDSWNNLPVDNLLAHRDAYDDLNILRKQYSTQ